MEFSIVWKSKAEKRFDKLQLNLQDRFLKKLDEVARDPFRYLKHFEGEGVCKLRIGEYRFLIDINLENKILIIQDFDKRGRVYLREESEEYSA
jgi:mRNA-degrading endonuclease RelE of RelBE toxin-antitoxin system